MVDYLKIIIVGLLATSFVSKTASAAYIFRNGGYDIVIAVDESTPPPNNVEQFRNNVQSEFHSFSIQLFLSTKRFFVNSVDLLIPQTWQLSSEIATSQSYPTADFKIAKDFDIPRVENPNTCGALGQHVELPVDFFNTSRLHSQYGEISKSLLNLFSRYRYGVWEEHGEIGNTKFPYYHYKPSQNPVWENTGCSADIQGKIVNQSGEESKECDVWSPIGPGESCRFVPSRTNTVNSSLAFFPWANSVDQFCNEETHNYEAPNRHNAFCGHRSVWQVITESEDYFSTIGGLEKEVEIPVLKFRVVKSSTKPLFFVLLDRGRTSASLKVLGDVTSSLQSFLNDTYLDQNIVATIGTFPSQDAGRFHYYVKDEAPWSTIAKGFSNFSRVIQSTLEHHDGPVVRDFGQAIQEVAEKIKNRNHKAGAVILIVKRGATQNAFEHLRYFGDVLTSLKEQNIRLYGIEFQQSEKTPYVNLQQLVSQTNGSLHVINGTTDIREGLEPIFEEIKSVLNDGLAASPLKRWTIHKGFVGLRRSVDIPILDENIEHLTICLTTKKYILESDIVIRQVEGTPAAFERSRRDEWNEVTDSSKRAVTMLKVVSPPQNSKWEVLIQNCTSTISDDCLAFLVASVESNSNVLSSELQIEVQTSAENNYFDFDRKGAKIAPFSIFAKVELDDQRVLSLDNVYATIVYNNLRHWIIQLLDDGGLGDVSSQDGIYSSFFTPPQDGVYKIFVSVSHHSVLNEISFDENDEPEKTVNLLGHLINIEQSQFGCYESKSRRCVAAKVSSYLGRTVDMIGTIFVANSITFTPRPTPIRDFSVTPLQDHKVKFGFTAPQILGIDKAQANQYRIYMASQTKHFVKGTDDLQLVLVQDGSDYLPGDYVELEYSAMTPLISYYAVEAIFRTQKSDHSNIVGTVINESGEPPVPQPTTTTPTTTSGPTTSIETSEDPFPTTARSTLFSSRTSTQRFTSTTSKLPTTTTPRTKPSSQTRVTFSYIQLSSLVLGAFLFS